MTNSSEMREYRLLVAVDGGYYRYLFNDLPLQPHMLRIHIGYVQCAMCACTEPYIYIHFRVPLANIVIGMRTSVKYNV